MSLYNHIDIQWLVEICQEENPEADREWVLDKVQMFDKHPRVQTYQFGKGEKMLVALYPNPNHNDDIQSRMNGVLEDCGIGFLKSYVEQKAFPNVFVLSRKTNPYPIYTKDNDEVHPGLYIGLWNGFKNEKERESVDGFGEYGALIGPLSQPITVTYGSLLKFSFAEGKASRADLYGLKPSLNMLMINKDGCVEFDGMEYGDFDILYVQNGSER